MSKFHLACYYRANAAEPVVQRHSEVCTALQRLDGVLGWARTTLPAPPDFGKELVASYGVRLQRRHVRCSGAYVYRDPKYLRIDRAAYDDSLQYQMTSLPLGLDYARLLGEEVPGVVEGFRSYRAIANFYLYSVKYENLHPEVVAKLRNDPAVDLDGRNNIFTLEVAQYWDAELCQRALGYGRDEVIIRLTGKVPLVRPLMDGVYVVFNDNPNLTFEEFCAYNDALKPVLGLA